MTAPVNPMRAPPPTLLQTLPRAVQIGATWALVVAGLVVAARLGFDLLSETGRIDGDYLLGLLALGGWLALYLVGPLFVLTILFLQRPWQDGLFNGVGLLATFFGLGMLFFFFTRMALDVQLYFEVMPRLVEEQNKKLEEKVRQAEENVVEAKANVLREMENAIRDAPTEAEKKEVRELYEKEVLPNLPKVLEELHKTAAECKAERDLGVRPDTSKWAQLVHFLTHGPSDQPQDVGILPALLGSLWVAVITILFAVPVGVGAALYLEEYRSNRWLGSVIQVNINNLAGIPSVVYGILGGFVFVELIFKPLAHWHEGIAARNVLGGGLTLGLLTLPVIIVSAQEAIRAVPSSIRQGAYALGATRWQVIRHQVLPQALPGILTGTILALSRAIGEAAPLILLGAVQFIGVWPTLFSRFMILPMQIFNWSDRPAVAVPGFAGRVEIGHTIAALASVLLLVVLLSLNGVAIYLRNRTQRQTRV